MSNVYVSRGLLKPLSLTSHPKFSYSLTLCTATPDARSPNWCFLYDDWYGNSSTGNACRTISVITGPDPPEIHEKIPWCAGCPSGNFSLCRLEREVEKSHKAANGARPHHKPKVNVCDSSWHPRQEQDDRNRPVPTQTRHKRRPRRNIRMGLRNSHCMCLRPVTSMIFDVFTKLRRFFFFLIPFTRSRLG